MKGLTADSRQVQSGYLFAALSGGKEDGRRFIPDALSRGAVAVLAAHGTRLEDSRAALITDSNPRRRFALLAAGYFAAQPAVTVAVTGTNGKTSVTNFTRQIWSHLGYAAASLGTIGLISPKRTLNASLTTPDPVSLHGWLAQMAEDGVSHAALEASSHGLDQHRLDGVKLAAAAFTNLTRDHLDYHSGMLAYRQAKLRLFGEILPAGGGAVINADSDVAEELLALCRLRGHRTISYGRNGAEIRLAGLHPAQQGQDLELLVAGRELHLHLPLAGAFQAENALAALGLALATGADPTRAIAALSHLEGVPGRLEHVATTGTGASLYVDYAHTPDALSALLSALRPHARKRLIVLFGCGGDRDPGKRPEMGAIAARLADRVFITDDNPRHENAAAIRAAIRAACPAAVEIADRREAIRTAIGGLADGDLLVLAGKGHETGQIIGDRTVPFDDAEEIRQILKDRS
ncbi:MAG TPA: UDP-N-acetylmuramoyl-L-alanyl-D-glutamate--2,6-diaminopimelate ligase [Rhodospirillaceae bacterium]|nr:UDP-N-acetylmuramoyl-L-alanyl-D-glutamate--2,6-diaminopimelate ligase [Rhodospirillaceae bacterium]